MGGRPVSIRPPDSARTPRPSQIPNWRLRRKGAHSAKNSHPSILGRITSLRGRYARKSPELYPYVFNSEEVLARVGVMDFGTRLGARNLLPGFLYGMRYVTMFDKITQGRDTQIEPLRVSEFRSETRDASRDIGISVSNPPAWIWGSDPHPAEPTHRKSAHRYGAYA